MANHDGNGKTPQRIAEMRSEPRYDGGLVASFTYTPIEGGVRVVECKVESLSASAMVITAGLHGGVGEHLWVELEGFGLVRCEIEEVRDDGFRCCNIINDAARKRLNTWVLWMRRHGGRIGGDRRVQMRTRPRDARTTVTLASGAVLPALLSDVSRSGAAVELEGMVAVGDAVVVGKVPSQVVRLFDGGFSVAFDVLLDAADADRLVAGYEVARTPVSRTA
jgi:hypothetical protein